MMAVVGMVEASLALIPFLRPFMPSSTQNRLMVALNELLFSSCNNRSHYITHLVRIFMQLGKYVGLHIKSPTHNNKGQLTPILK